MPLIEEKYDQHKVDSLKRYLQREAEKNRKKDYEIIVDGFKIVSRTDNIDEFEDYEQEIKPGSHNVSILIYDGPGTNRNTRYSFLLQHDTSSGKGLNGTDDLGSIIQEKLDARDREHEMTRLKEKLDETQAQLDEAEEYTDILEQKIKDLESGEHKKMVGLGDVAGLVINGWLKSNPQLIAKLPGGETLAGLLDLPVANKVPVSEREETAASFEKADRAEQKTAGMKPKEGGWQQYRSQLEGSFDEEQQQIMFAIMAKLSSDPQQLYAVAEFLKLQNE